MTVAARGGSARSGHPSPSGPAGCCVVAPLHAGGGMRVKILEALARGLPVISTRLGAEGIAARDGEEILLADGAEEFAAAVLRLLRDPALAARLAENGRALVEREYDYRVTCGTLGELYQRLLG
mgnify:CR=1 FL=1